MSAEFVDTNILIYAHDASAGRKHEISLDLITRLTAEGSGVVSTQVLAEFFSVATRKLRLTCREAREIILDFGSWQMHRPTHASLLEAADLQQRHQISWWDALIVNSAIELGCSTVWTEDLNDGQRFLTVTARNPFV
jgi:predicted nucleic acid-binding protein